MWNEFNCGREGTHLASALIKALKQIVSDNPLLEHLILWSDSCVPQNRNSYMSAALQHFLNSEFSGCLTQIDQKYSEAGHGEVQEVDNVHSIVEKFIRHKFIYSSVSLIKEFRKMESGKLNFKLLEMNDDDYFDYQALALASKYSVIPYTKVTQLRYKEKEPEISYKLDFADDFIENKILLKQNHDTLPPLNQLQIHSNITSVKIANLKTMFSIMPEVDRLYYELEIAKLSEKRGLCRGTSDETSGTDVISSANGEISMENVVRDVRAGKPNKRNGPAAMTSSTKIVASSKTIAVKQTSKDTFIIDKERPAMTSTRKSRAKPTDKVEGQPKKLNGRPISSDKNADASKSKTSRRTRKNNK